MTYGCYMIVEFLGSKGYDTAIKLEKLPSNFTNIKALPEVSKFILIIT